MTGEVIDPRGKSTFAASLDQYNFLLYFKYSSSYIYREEYFSPLTKETSFCNRWETITEFENWSNTDNKCL